MLVAALASLMSSVAWAYGSSKYALYAQKSSPAFVNLIRACVAAPLFLICAIFLDSAAFVWSLAMTPHLAWLMLSALSSYVIGDVFFYMASARIGTATALAIASTYPMWASILGASILNESLHSQQWAGIISCILGIITLVYFQPSSHAHAVSLRKHIIQGAGLAFLASILWASNSYAVSQGQIKNALFLTNAIRYFSAFFILFVFYQLKDKMHLKKNAKDKTLNIKTLGIKLFPTIFVEAFLGSIFFVYGFSHGSLSQGAALSSLSPFFAVIFERFLRHRKTTYYQLLGMCFTLIGVLLIIL